MTMARRGSMSLEAMLYLAAYAALIAALFAGESSGLHGVHHAAEQAQQRAALWSQCQTLGGLSLLGHYFSMKSGWVLTDFTSNRTTLITPGGASVPCGGSVQNWIGGKTIEPLMEVIV